mmetsp:Transcript_54144/g.175959  ORF Transcript_54144/g.175959 Transcript_54144/m.175959 type:complete len:398 (-) Transcript_54144:1094-2287(-)
MLLEGIQPVPNTTNVFGLEPQDAVEAGDVRVHVGSRAVHIVQVEHLLLDELHHHVDVLPVRSDELLLLCQDGSDQAVVLPRDFVQRSLRRCPGPAGIQCQLWGELGPHAGVAAATTATAKGVAPSVVLVGKSSARAARQPRRQQPVAERAALQLLLGEPRRRVLRSLSPRVAAAQGAAAAEGRARTPRVGATSQSVRAIVASFLKAYTPTETGAAGAIERVSQGRCAGATPDATKVAGPSAWEWRYQTIVPTDAAETNTVARAYRWPIGFAASASQLLDAVRITQGVQRVLDGAAARGDVGDHDRAAVATHEGVLEHLGQLRAAEGSVAVLLVKRADALLQRQEGLVDLGTVHARLAVGVHGIGAALAAGQINEGDLAVLLYSAVAVLHPLVLQADL